MSRITTDQLTHDAGAKTFTGEVSSLSGRSFGTQVMVTNPNTGKSVRFYYDCVKYTEDYDREVVGYRFTIAPECVRDNPDLAGYTLFLYND